MCQELLGPNSPLWRFKDIALTLAASIPSGDPAILDICSQIAEFNLGKASWRMSGQRLAGFFTLDVLQNLETFNAADMILVGYSPVCSPTPWINPLLFGEFSLSSFAGYYACRADRSKWLAHLYGKTLVCNCTEYVGQGVSWSPCHAEFLSHKVQKLVDEQLPKEPAHVAAEDNEEDHCINDEQGDFSEFAVLDVLTFSWNLRSTC